MLWSPPVRSLRSPLALALAVAGILVVSRLRLPGASGPLEPEPGCGEGNTAACPPGETGDSVATANRAREKVLRREVACTQAGFLCSGMDGADELRIVRWPDDTPELRIFVPLPPDLPLPEARSLQRAAAQGIRAWQGHPFPLSISTRGPGEDKDFSVEWRRAVDDGRLGLTRVEWLSQENRVSIQVVEFALATVDPRDGRTRLGPEEVELVATHEMGHALGLPHSDDPRDVMFPENTATRLTVRDFRTLGALYALPNGAVIR